MMNTPFVMVYRVSPLTYALGKPRVKVPRFAMVNLIAEEEVVPELVQHDFTAANVVARLKKSCPTVRRATACCKVWRRSKPGFASRNRFGKLPASADRAAEIILSHASTIARASQSCRCNPHGERYADIGRRAAPGRRDCQTHSSESAPMPSAMSFRSSCFAASLPTPAIGNRPNPESRCQNAVCLSR